MEGELPCARRGTSAAASGRFVILFGGCAADEQGEAVPLNDLYLLEVAGPTLVRCGRQESSGTLPSPRSGALLQEHSDGRLLLFGGSDAAGKPLGDAWLLDMATLTWECLYDAAPEAAALPVGVPPFWLAGAMCALERGLTLQKLPFVTATTCCFHNLRPCRPQSLPCTPAAWCAWCPPHPVAPAWMLLAALTCWPPASLSHSWPACGPRWLPPPRSWRRGWRSSSMELAWPLPAAR